ncbi:MAG: nucleotidyltransferase family protein [Paraglaciecola sp.]|nr:nucleotidyltransferase family protein [Paraglaciecola sp.]
MDILAAVSTLALPDCWVAAGFVRNLVWDHLHNKNTDLNDVDVIYYSQTDTQSQLATNATSQLKKLLPEVNWQVKNQALMHIKRQHCQYANSRDAMTFWPEKETAVAVNIDKNGHFSILEPFALTSLFNGFITFNPKADAPVFWRRIEQKRWLTTWPRLVVNPSSD